MKKRHVALGLLDTVENNPKKRTIEMKNHTIEITEIDDELVSNTGLFLGTNQTHDSEMSEKVMMISIEYFILIPFLRTVQNEEETTTTIKKSK